MGNLAKESLTPRSTPDVAKLNSMTNRVVAVTKLVKGAARLVLPPWKNVTVDQIQGLHSSLPLQHGGGTYKFEVSEIDGNERDSWTVRLGPEIQESSVPGGDMPISSVPAGEAAAGSIDIGGGFRYNEQLGLLVTPNREVHQWRPGSPLPGSMGAQQNQNWFAGGQTMPPTPFPPYTGWGGYPTWDEGGSGTNSKVTALERQLAEERDRRREDEHRREIDTLRNSMEKSVERLTLETNSKFESLIGKLTENRGPSEAEKRLEQLEQERRLDLIRAESREQQNKFEMLVKELSTNKQDPMLTLFGTMLQTQQAAQGVTAQAIKDTAVAAAEQAKENSRLMSERLGSASLTPERLMEILRVAKDQTGNTEMMKGALEMYKNLFGMSQDVLKMQADMYQSSGEPAWVGIAQQTVDQIGRVANVYASKKAETESAAQIRALQAARMQQQQQRQRPQQPLPRPMLPMSASPAPAAAPASNDALRAKAEAQSNKSLGKGKKANGASGPARVAPAAAVEPRRRRRRVEAEPAPEAASEMSPAEQLMEAPTEQVKAITDAIPDDMFFGMFYQNVLELRQAVGNLQPQEVANFVIRAQATAAGYGELPPAIEMLVTDHIDILVDRLLPESSAEFRVAVGDAIRIQMRAGAADEGEEGDDAAA